MNQELHLDSESAIVRNIHDGFVEVQMKKTASCESCSINGFCHAGDDDNSLIPIETDLNLKVDDEVSIYIAPSSRIFSSALIFLFPILSMIIFYSISKFTLSFSENYSIAASFAGLLLSGFTIKLLDTKLSDKIKFEILGKVKNENSSK